MNCSRKDDLRKKWLKNNWLKILFNSIVIVLFFVGAIIFNKFAFVILGIVYGFFSYFWGRNKMSAYIEKNI